MVVLMPRRMYNNFIPVIQAHISSDQVFNSTVPKVSKKLHIIGFWEGPPITHKFQCY